MTLAARKKIRLTALCWVFMVPTVVSYLVFQGIPILTGIYYSFLDWSGLSSRTVFAGLANYRELLGDQIFWNSVKNSFIYTFQAVPLFLAVSLTFAYILNMEALRGRVIFRTFLFIPVITTASIIGIVMVFIWGSTGPVNTILLKTRIVNEGIRWLGDAKTAMTTVVFISVWKDMGTYMIYWLAGLSSIPQDLYEAADVDGAGRVRTLFQIVLPMMLPIAGTITLLNIINSLKVFDIIKTMTNGGPYYATDVIATFVYRAAFASEIGMPRMGYASAAAFAFGIIVITVTLGLQGLKRFFKKFGE
jgi:multiple sugar transport system permease protein